MRKSLLILIVLFTVFLAIGCAQNGTEQPNETVTPVEEVTPVEAITPVEAVTPAEEEIATEEETPMEEYTPAISDEETETENVTIENITTTEREGVIKVTPNKGG